MLKNHFTFALRNLRKQPLYTFINVLGLAVGLACCLLIGLYVYHAWSYDRFHEKADRIYRVVQERRVNITQRLAIIGGWAAPEMKAQIPEIEEAVRLSRQPLMIRHAEEAFPNQTMLAADQSFLDVFTFPMRRGAAAEALTAPYTMVLTESAAQRYFGEADPIGQTLSVSGPGYTGDYTVSGIMADVPPNSHLHFEGVISLATAEAIRPEAFQRGARVATYLLLAEGVDPAVLDEKLDAFVVRRFGEEALEDLTYRIQPLTDIHLHSSDIVGIHDVASMGVVYTLATIALFVLLIACINFMNLSTARASKRAREVGVRKSLGAQRRGLMGQFYTESIALTMLAVVLALLLVRLAFPAFISLTGKALSVDLLYTTPVLLMALAAALFIGLLAGSYPAFVLSGFQPVQALRGEMTRQGKGVRFRQGLVVFQFTVTIALFAATTIAFRQLDYVRTKDLGFDQEHLIGVSVPGGRLVVERLQEAWSTLAGVREITADSRRSVGSASSRLLGREADTSFVELRYFFVADNYIETLGIDVTHGRTFSPEIASDSAGAALINKAAVRLLGWSEPEDALGEQLRFFRNQWQIIGVVDDFHHGSLHKQVEPLLIEWRPGSLRRLLVRAYPEHVSQTLAALGAIWREHIPDHPFSYAFLDDMLAQLYEDDRTQGQVFGLFAAVAIFIACLGLFGLVSFSAEQRTKEIGVRKVLGASVGSILLLFSKEFLVLFGLAFLIATPVAYLAMSRWLENFAYRTSIGVEVFLLAGLATLTIALMTVSYQSIRAATANPVKALRYE